MRHLRVGWTKEERVVYEIATYINGLEDKLLEANKKLKELLKKVRRGR